MAAGAAHWQVATVFRAAGAAAAPWYRATDVPRRRALAPARRGAAAFRAGAAGGQWRRWRRAGAEKKGGGAQRQRGRRRRGRQTESREGDSIQI